jgi:hypothetical protein
MTQIILMKKLIIVLSVLAAFYYFLSPYENCMREPLSESDKQYPNEHRRQCNKNTKW